MPWSSRCTRATLLCIGCQCESVANSPSNIFICKRWSLASLTPALCLQYPADVIPHALCPTLYVPLFSPHVLCPISTLYALFSMPYTPFSIPNYPCSMSHSLGPIFHSPCSMPNSQRPMPPWGIRPCLLHQYTRCPKPRLYSPLFRSRV